MAAISAATASLIAAGVTGATAVATATMSFAQAGEAKAKAAEATKAADKAIAEAKSKLDVNYYDVLGIQKEPYELQREALLSQGAQTIQAAREGEERGVAAAAGRVQLAQNEAQQGIRTQEGQDLMALQKLSAAENSRLRDVGAQINLEEVQGANLANANYNKLAGQSMTQGMQSLVNAGGAFASMLPLYSKQNPQVATTNANPASLNQGIFSNTEMPQPTTLGAPALNQGFFNNTMPSQQFNYANPFGAYYNQQGQQVFS
jgi:hypothetical protein